jgi:hypothetical protein
MMKKIGITFAMAVLLMAAMAAPSFAQDANAYEQQILQARYDSVSARVGFTTGVMADIVSLIPQASDLLDPQIEKLNSDLATLSGYVAAVDNNGFNSYVCGTINPDLQAAHQAMAEARTHYREWGVTPQTRQELKVKYDARKATFDAQMQQVTLQLGNIRLTHYNDAVARANDQMSRLSAKGVDVTGVQGVVDGAQSSVIAPLQSAVASGSPEAVRAELKDKCLGNGAPYSYHFWARKDIQVTSAISANIADSATGAGYGDELADVNAKIEAAQSTLESVGTSPYTAGQQDTIWNNLKSAAEGLKNIIKGLGGH